MNLFLSLQIECSTSWEHAPEAASYPAVTKVHHTLIKVRSRTRKQNTQDHSWQQPRVFLGHGGVHLRYWLSPPVSFSTFEYIIFYFALIINSRAVKCAQWWRGQHYGRITLIKTSGALKYHMDGSVEKLSQISLNCTILLRNALNLTAEWGRWNQVFHTECKIVFELE